MLMGGAVLLLALISGLLGPEAVSMGLGGILSLALIGSRPEWGVGALLTMFTLQYPWISRTLAGSGLLSPNNVLALLLFVIMAYWLLRDGDWSFLRSRQVQLTLIIVAGIFLSSLLNPVESTELTSLGLTPRGQDPARLMLARGLFLVLFVFFARGPRELRLLLGIFLCLSLITALTGSIAGLTGSGMLVRGGEGYRAGGTAVAARAAVNPNRLAMTSVLAMILIWEYGQSESGRRWAWLASAAVLGLVLTVFLTASRGGLVGLALAGFLLMARRRAGARRLLYGAMLAVVAIGVIAEFVPEQNLERLGNLPGLSQDASGAGQGSIARRQYALKVALGIFLEHPLLGVGAGNWEKERFLRDPARSVAVPHNSYMLVLAEQGLPALAVYLLLFGTTLRQLMQLEREPEAMRQASREGLDWIITGTRLCLVLFLIFSLFGDLWENITMYILLGTAAVLLRRYLPEQAQLSPA